MAGQFKMLIAVNDQKLSAPLVRNYRERGWEVFPARDAFFTISIALRERPQAIVLDADLPGGGQTALQRIRQSIHTSSIPVIALVKGDSRQRNDMLKAGAQICLDIASLKTTSIDSAVQKAMGTIVSVTTAPAHAIQNPERLTALAESGLLDTQQSCGLDQLTLLTAKILSVPIALLSLVDHDRQFFKSHFGLSRELAATRHTPLTHSFCQWVVSGNEELVIGDANVHPVLRSNLAIRDLGVIAYAGIPVIADNNQAIGSFCAIDLKPHNWSEEDLVLLRELAMVAQAQIIVDRLQLEPSRLAHHSGNPMSMRTLTKGSMAAVSLLRSQNKVLDEAARDFLCEAIVNFGEQLLLMPLERRRRRRD